MWDSMNFERSFTINLTSSSDETMFEKEEFDERICCLFNCCHQNGLISDEKMITNAVSFLYSCIICWLGMYKRLLPIDDIFHILSEMIPKIGEWTNDFDELDRFKIPIEQIYEDTPFYESFMNSDLCKKYSNRIRFVWCLIQTNVAFLINFLFVMVCLFVHISILYVSKSEQI